MLKSASKQFKLFNGENIWTTVWYEEIFIIMYNIHTNQKTSIRNIEQMLISKQCVEMSFQNKCLMFECFDINDDSLSNMFQGLWMWNATNGPFALFFCIEKNSSRDLGNLTLVLC